MNEVKTYIFIFPLKLRVGGLYTFMQWMPIEEYAAQPFVQKYELLKCSVDICLAKKDGNYAGFSPVPTSSAFSNEKSYMYFNIHDLNKQ